MDVTGRLQIENHGYFLELSGTQRVSAMAHFNQEFASIIGHMPVPQKL
jgi:hypothetical protein